MSDPAGDPSRDAWPVVEPVPRFWKRATWLGRGVADAESNLVTRRHMDAVVAER